MTVLKTNEGTNREIKLNLPRLKHISRITTVIIAHAFFTIVINEMQR